MAHEPSPPRPRHTHPAGKEGHLSSRGAEKKLDCVYTNDQFIVETISPKTVCECAVPIVTKADTHVARSS